MIPDRLLEPAGFSLAALLRPGDEVVCGQACAEPLTLTRQLVADCAVLQQPVRVFVGTLFSRTFDAAPATMRFRSYGAIGRASVIADAGRLDVLPERYSRLADLFASGTLPADVVLLQAAPGEDGAPPSLGLACDYVLDAARRARVVVVEVNPDVPWTHGTPWPDDLRVDHWVRAAQPPLTLEPPAPDAVADRIALHVASIVPEGATLQVGVGSLPDATLQALRGHRWLGLHSGVLGDAGTQLIAAGAIDNSRKGVDAGISVANTVCGSATSYRFVHRNPAVQLRHSRQTHGAAVLRQLERLHAINGALEVDLSGQVNAEELQGRQRGGVGGLLDFARAARDSAGGRGITVLPATAAGGKASRIVATLAGRPATIGRSDVDTVVTEYGIAQLRDTPLAERARRLIAIAAPEFRDALAAQWQAARGASA
ncbi:MAG: 4-hydroxybutyrate CoA-transferase [Comamonadaceae bacterium]|nr:MAG: 4-hydroxybutyrate CoA-transferase [Comamonadaceae bacterium]